jgi:hypothetical protein
MAAPCSGPPKGNAMSVTVSLLDGDAKTTFNFKQQVNKMICVNESD